MLHARLAARLTGFKIDIKSETQAREAGDFYMEDLGYEDYPEDLQYTDVDYADEEYTDEDFATEEYIEDYEQQ